MAHTEIDSVSKNELKNTPDESKNREKWNDDCCRGKKISKDTIVKMTRNNHMDGTDSNANKYRRETGRADESARDRGREEGDRKRERDRIRERERKRERERQIEKKREREKERVR